MDSVSFWILLNDELLFYWKLTRSKYNRDGRGRPSCIYYFINCHLSIRVKISQEFCSSEESHQKRIPFCYVHFLMAFNYVLPRARCHIFSYSNFSVLLSNSIACNGQSNTTCRPSWNLPVNLMSTSFALAFVIGGYRRVVTPYYSFWTNSFINSSKYITGNDKELIKTVTIEL